MEPILEIAALKKYYGKEPNLTRALDGISFQVMPGEFLGIMGSSGSGKSTLLNCIATVIAPTGGAVALHDKCITTLHGKALADYRGKEIGYLFQNFELIDNLTGRENILLPLALHGVSEGESRERLLARIGNVLKRYEGRPNLLEGADFLLDRQTYTLYIHNQSVVLPPNQGKLLETLLAHGGQTTTKDELSRALWGTTEFIDENALQVNLTRLKKTMASLGMCQQLVSVRGVGYRLEVAHEA